jgi:AhpD family alkylhydroperoxidase
LHGLQALGDRSPPQASASRPDRGGRSRADDRAAAALPQSAPGRRGCRIDRAAPGFSAWILEDDYGRVLARDGLTTADRELLAIVALAVLDCPSQQKSHVRGALRLGVSLEQIYAAVDLATDGLTAESSRRAREVVDAEAGGGH